MVGEEFRQKLFEETCFGTFLKLPRPEVVHVLGFAGFDFVICDMEHAQMTEIEARAVIIAANEIDLPVVVRLPDAQQGVVNRLLEAGAVGIQIPRLRTASDTRQLYQMMHYPPAGVRSVGNANMLAGYGSVPVTEYLRKANDRTVVIGQFETQQIDDPIEPMLEGLDIAFIGPMDLSADFGAPGQFDDPAVVDRIRHVENAVQQTKTTVMGGFAGTLAAAERFVEAGYRFIAVGGDVSLLSNASKSLVKSLHELL